VRVAAGIRHAFNRPERDGNGTNTCQRCFLLVVANVAVVWTCYQ
jgi:hypothetical protein